MTTKHFKSLSDSSTSESEEDYGKRSQQKGLSYVPYISTLKRKHSTDDTEDEHLLEHIKSKVPAQFKSPHKYPERGMSTDDTEDEQNEVLEPPAKNFNSSFRPPSQYIDRDLSDSESDDKSSLKSTSKSAASMPTFNGNYGVGMKLMEKMGYKTGTGLGKFEQGRVEIVEASKQRGRRGLGLHIAGLEPSDTKWDFEKDQISIKEEVVWMPECHSEPLTINMLRGWIKYGEKKETIDDETEFCDPDILKDVLTYKSVFDELDPEEMRKARTRSNPFETIRGGIFLNRAAMKMANMDSVFDFMFTDPKTKNGDPFVHSNELLYFADICAGPGGFSEYVLWRKKWHCKGFGFTLKGANDFKLEDFFSGPPETFEPYYGVTGDGDIYSSSNLRDFKKFVLTNTDEKGVHFVMADGGFSVEGQENIQEVLSKRLYLCQFLCALYILRKGGHFVCKLFDLFTPFSVGLLYLMYHAFEKVCIFKPNTSRPANSERYIICKWRKENVKDISDYMYEVNCEFEKNNVLSTRDVQEIVPLNVLKNDEPFCNYIIDSNNNLGRRQVIHLDKIKAFAQNTELHDENQNELRKQCLALWKVPDKVRSAPSRPEPEAKFKKLIQGENLKYLSSSPETLTKAVLSNIKSVFDYHCVVCGDFKPDHTPSLFISVGRSYIYRYDLKNSKWGKIEATLELPDDTLFYGELVLELKGEGRAQRKITCLHIIDAIFLGGTDVRKNFYESRMQLAGKLSKAVSKPSRPDYTPLRVKKVWELQNVEEVFDRLSLKFTKNCQVPRLCFDLGDGRHIIPTGLLIFKTTQDPWMTAFSRTNQRTYLFNTKQNISNFDRTDETKADFKSCFSRRLFWNWQGVKLIPEQNCESRENALHGQAFVTYIKENLRRMTGRPY